MKNKTKILGKAAIFTMLLGTAFNSNAQNWLTAGNALTSGGFLGTTNTQDLIFKTNNVQNMVIQNSTGDVGIGVSSPGNFLDISAGSRSGTHITGDALYVTGNLGSNTGIRFAHNNATQGINFGYSGISKYASTGSNNNLTIDAASTGNLLFQTSATGYVGIGTASPAMKLDVNGANSSGQTAAFRNGNSNIFLTSAMAATAFNPLTQSGDNGIFWTDQNNAANSSSSFIIAPWSSSTYGMRLDGSSGNFTVGGQAYGAYATTLGMCGSSAIGYGTSYIGFNASRSSSGTWTAKTDAAHNGGNIIYGDINGNLRFVNIPNSSTPTVSQTLSDATVYTNTIMQISNNGKVLIGNPFGSSPFYTQNMNTPGAYNLYVTGGILTEQVRVAVVNTSGWADYVFADGYKLKPLSEVEQYLKDNKHLPDVPSTTEVTKNGIDVATMDATLLKKIEELTLYTIELQKQNTTLEKSNSANAAKIDQLEEQMKALVSGK